FCFQHLRQIAPVGSGHIPVDLPVTCPPQERPPEQPLHNGENKECAEISADQLCVRCFNIVRPKYEDSASQRKPEGLGLTPEDKIAINHPEKDPQEKDRHEHARHPKIDITLRQVSKPYGCTLLFACDLLAGVFYGSL